MRWRGDPCSDLALTRFCPLHPSSVSALERPSHQDAPQWLRAPAARGRVRHIPFLPQEGGDLWAQVRQESQDPSLLQDLVGDRVCMERDGLGYLNSISGRCGQVLARLRTRLLASQTPALAVCSLFAVPAATCHRSASPRCAERTPAAAPHPLAAIVAPKRKGKCPRRGHVADGGARTPHIGIVKVGEFRVIPQAMR